MQRARQLFRRAAQWAAQSVWWPLFGKGVVAALAFLALAHVGHRAAERLTGPASEPPPNEATSTVGDGDRGPSGDHALHGHTVAAHVVALASATASPSASCKPAGSAGAAKAWTEDGKLILNLATAADLTKLPRIGAKRAEAIITLRTKLGRFKRVRDLLRIRGIGYRLLQKLKPLVLVDPPATKTQPKMARGA